MKLLRDQLDKLEPRFQPGGPLEKAFALFEMADTFLFTPGTVTRAGAHVRDYLDQKRMMIMVALAVMPAAAFGVYNIGLQALTANAAGAGLRDDWQTAVFEALGMATDPADILACVVYGLCYFVPIFLVVHIVGGIWEVLFATVRKHEINEGFLVTGALFPLICPPTIPLWQVALGITFGVVVGKELFGGVGRNVLNPALTGRAFLFFAYPAQISGDKVWIPAEDAYSGATPLADASAGGLGAIDSTWLDAFYGFVPGSIGEVSALACFIGMALLILTKVGSWRIVFGGFLGTALCAWLLNMVGSETNPMFEIPFWWHYVLGGWAFGIAFMATDPVSAAYTRSGKLAYGFLIGVVVVLIRVVNPAYPEGMMLAILFMNLFSPLLDHFVVQRNIKRRMARYAA
ncbi:MAG TPA: NADH:ubiquinone reductase (Na(+)-transporting) subunit B [Myxococcota bacterium]|nr:NADH:ubiquinone reductase (Na(+)-transporting) subunit B [Myxococcota bacterium]